MMKKIAFLLLLMLIVLPGCLEDPDPLPQTIRTYEYFYNYLMESYDIQWEIDEKIIGSGHSYGVPAQAVIELDESQQEVLFLTRNPDTGLLLDSLSGLLFENGSYMLAMLGNEEEPHLLFKPLDTRPPTSGMIKIHFMHAAPTMNPVDIYVGGNQPGDKVLSALDYTSVTEYLEIAEDKLWEALIITPANSLPADSTILSYTANTIFKIGNAYLCTIGHNENDIESPFLIQVDEHPVY
ncbi:MAG: hypothetical protein P1P86_01080 [Bacteroidales bacterium]|nr:hypothetical protein [Bacteroidales bacterium]